MLRRVGAIGRRPRLAPPVHLLRSACLSSSARPGEVDFSDAQLAYSAMSNADLVRAIAVFTACGFGPVVRNAEALLSTATRVFGHRFVAALVRPTFFKHFCVGEDVDGIAPVLSRLRAFGIGGILDYAAEADLVEPTGAPENSAGHPGRITFESHGVSTAPVYSARVYHYADERQCDANAAIFAEAIGAVRDVTPDGFAAIKLTALGNPALLERWSTAILQAEDLFERIANKAQCTDVDPHTGMTVMDWPTFLSGFREYFHDVDEDLVERTFRRHAAVGATGALRLSANDWCQELDMRRMASLSLQCKSQGRFYAASLDEGEQALVGRMIERVEELADLAARSEVRLMIDAEHSYFQPAIDRLVIGLQRKHNTSSAKIFGTYQCYLTGTTNKLAAHIAVSEKEGWHFAAKMVRGAYMHLERARAKHLGSADPIHTTLEATHACYDGCVDMVLRRESVADGRSMPNLLVASHNQSSIEFTLARMAELGIDRGKAGGVAFGQLYGMSDHLTFTLGQHGYLAYKYVPYGPLHEVLPYLVRRAQENSDMLKASGNERAMLVRELWRRTWRRGGA